MAESAADMAKQHSEAERAAEELHARMERYRLTPDFVEDTSLRLLEVDGALAVARHSLTAVIGGVGSRKTTFVSLLLSAIHSEQPIFDGFKPCEGGIGKPILWFDTEQDPAESFWHLVRVRNLSHDTDESLMQWFNYYNVGEILLADRWQFIEDCIRETHPSVVAIDGLRDLCSSINDEAEANFVMERLSQAAITHNFASIVCIHANPRERSEFTKAQGVLGSLVGQRAKSLIFVKPDPDNPREQSIVTFEKVRGRTPAKRLFKMDAQGEVQLLPMEDSTPAQQVKKVSLDDIWRPLFGSKASLRSGELQKAYIEANAKADGKPCTGRTAMTAIREAVDMGILVKTEISPREVYYSMHATTYEEDIDFDSSEEGETPF